jgi:hypothetical protein
VTLQVDLGRTYRLDDLILSVDNNDDWAAARRSRIAIA